MTHEMWKLLREIGEAPGLQDEVERAIEAERQDASSRAGFPTVSRNGRRELFLGSIAGWFRSERERHPIDIPGDE